MSSERWDREDESGQSVTRFFHSLIRHAHNFTQPSSRFVCRGLSSYVAVTVSVNDAGVLSRQIVELS